MFYFSFLLHFSNNLASSLVYHYVKSIDVCTWGYICSVSTDVAADYDESDLFAAFRDGKYRANVTKILEKNGKVCGVNVSKGTENHDIFAPLIISSAGTSRFNLSLNKLYYNFQDYITLSRICFPPKLLPNPTTDNCIYIKNTWTD